MNTLLTSREKKLSSTHSEWLGKIESMRDLVLGNLVMVGQIPSETFKEKERGEFVLSRFEELDKIKTYTDEAGNVVGVLKGRTSKRKIVLSASMDTRFDDKVDHDIAVNMHTAKGAGIANNSMGLAALISLPEILTQLELEFDADLIFLGTTRSLGRGDLEGMRHFFESYPFSVDYVLNLVGTTLGRVDHFCLSAVRGDITCMVESPDEFSGSGFSQNNAIVVMNELINSLLSIPLSSRPKTSLNLGRIRGGESYSTPCPAAHLNLYVWSESDPMTDKVMESISDCCVDTGSKNGVQFEVNFFGRQRAAGLRFSHPLVKRTIEILEMLGYKPRVAPSNTQIAVPLSRDIPSITLGITTGRQSILPDGHVDLEPIPKGMLQVLMLADAIDKGFNNV